MASQVPIMLAVVESQVALRRLFVRPFYCGIIDNNNSYSVH